MNRLVKSFLIILICFVIDSTISFFLPYNFARQTITIVPYIGLMFFTLLVKHLDSPENYFYAVICGTYYTVVYSHSLAIYILIYFLIAFIRCFVIKIEKFSLFESSLFCISTIFITEIIVYWLMWVTNMTSYPIIQFIIMRLLPTLGLNFVFSLLVYGIYNYIDTEVKL